MDEFRTMLRRHGLRATRQRLLVHEAMMQLEHASADMVYSLLSNKEAGVTTAAVHNILSQLSDNRIYSRRMSAGSKMFYDVDNSRHVHMYDRENNTWRNLEDDGLGEMVQARLKRRRFKGYTMEGIDIQIVTVPSKNSKKKKI